MPEKGCPLDNAFVDAQLWALLVLLNKLSPEREDPSHKVLLLVITPEDTVIFFAEVPEVMQSDERFGTFCDQLDIHVLGKEKVVVLSKHA